MDLSAFSIVETKFEYKTVEFIYHITVGRETVYIKRTRADRPMWTHGVLTEGYDTVARAFVPMCMVTNMKMNREEMDKVFKSF